MTRSADGRVRPSDQGPTIAVTAEKFNCIQKIVTQTAEIPMGSVLDSVEMHTVARRVRFSLGEENTPQALKRAKEHVRAYLSGRLVIEIETRKPQ